MPVVSVGVPHGKKEMPPVASYRPAAKPAPVQGYGNMEKHKESSYAAHTVGKPIEIIKVRSLGHVKYSV